MAEELDVPAELVHLSVDGAVAHITLDSPRNRNALSRQLVSELFERLESVRDDPSIKVVLLSSSGRVFCSGADLSEAAAGSMQEGAQRIIALQRLILTLPQTVVVRLDGPVRAGGIGIVAAADVVLASREANFAFTEVKLGLAVAIISLTVLPRMTSRGAALTLLGGESFTADEAVALGLVTTAVPAEELDGAVTTLLGQIQTGASQGLRETKRLLNRDVVASIDARGDEMAELSAGLFGSDEAREAMTAFLGRGKA